MPYGEEIRIKVDDLARSLDRLNETVQRGFNDIHQHLINPSDPTEGLIVRARATEKAVDAMRGLPERVKTLEHNEKSRQWWARTTATAAIGAVVVTLWDLIRSGQHGK